METGVTLFLEEKSRGGMSGDIATPSDDVSASSAIIITSNGECFMMFHNVLRVSQHFLGVHDVLLMFQAVSQCFTCVS